MRRTLPQGPLHKDRADARAGEGAPAAQEPSRVGQAVLAGLRARFGYRGQAALAIEPERAALFAEIRERLERMEPYALSPIVDEYGLTPEEVHDLLALPWRSP